MSNIFPFPNLDDLLDVSRNNHRWLSDETHHDEHPPSTTGGGGAEGGAPSTTGGGGAGGSAPSSSSSGGGSGGSGRSDSSSAGSSGRSGGSGTSSSSTSGTSSSSTSGSSSSSTSGTSSSSTSTSSGGSSGNVAKSSYEEVQSNNSLGGFRLAALIAAGLLVALLLATFILVMRKRQKKKKNRGGKGAVVLLNKVEKERELDSAELGTVASSNYDYENPTSGTYRSLEEPETELDLSFNTTTMDGNSDYDDQKHFSLAGTGFHKCDQDSHVGFVRVVITEGYASLNGSTAWWVEERRPFIDNLHNRGAMCPRPRYKCCSSTQGVPGLETKFSFDGKAVHRVECRGSFDYEKNTFEGQWAQQSKMATHHSDQLKGTYKLLLKAPQPSNETRGDDDDESEAPKSRIQRWKKGLLSLFQKDSRSSNKNKFSSKQVLITVIE
jgi:hypothetical protein